MLKKKLNVLKGTVSKLFPVLYVIIQIKFVFKHVLCIKYQPEDIKKM